MGLTRTDVKIIVSTLFSALIGVTIANALNCIGNGCWATDSRDIVTACVSIIVFFFTYYVVATRGKPRSSSRRRTRG